MLTPRDLYVGNDTGTMHLAAAAGCSCVEISPHPMDGDPGVGTSPVRFAPHGVPAIVLRPSTGLGACNRQCTAGGPHCIDVITVDDVWEAAQQLSPALSGVANAYATWQNTLEQAPALQGASAGTLSC
jgi:ADP-heptose:LPS heptosyltransferase